MRIPKYKQHERMGEGDPIRMAGLPMQSGKHKGKGKLSKNKRNKLLRDLHGDAKKFWEAHGRLRID